MEALYNVALSELPIIVVMVVSNGRTHSPARNDSASLSYYRTRSAVPNTPGTRPGTQQGRFGPAERRPARNRVPSKYFEVVLPRFVDLAGSEANT